MGFVHIHIIAVVTIGIEIRVIGVKIGVGVRGVMGGGVGVSFERNLSLGTITRILSRGILIPLIHTIIERVFLTVFVNTLGGTSQIICEIRMMIRNAGVGRKRTVILKRITVALVEVTKTPTAVIIITVQGRVGVGKIFRLVGVDRDAGH